jgi:Lar family restriction alleviation protein
MMKLLPCPFCGSDDAAINTVRYSQRMMIKQGWGQSEFYGVNCITCGVNNIGLIGHGTEEEAAEAWNTRCVNAPLGKQP